MDYLSYRWINYSIILKISVDLAYCEIFRLKLAFCGKVVLQCSKLVISIQR